MFSQDCRGSTTFTIGNQLLLGSTIKRLDKNVFQKCFSKRFELLISQTRLVISQTRKNHPKNRKKLQTFQISQL